MVKPAIDVLKGMLLPEPRPLDAVMDVPVAIVAALLRVHVPAPKAMLHDDRVSVVAGEP